MELEKDKYNKIIDQNLIQLILDGNKEALNSLIIRYKDWIYNVALRMAGNTYEAEDVTQEVIIKIITKLSSFKFKSSFKTWVYRITTNHFLNMKQYGKANIFLSFDNHEKFFENLPDKELDGYYSIEKKHLIDETKIECMLGMLLCLNKEQRMVFTLGGILGLNSYIGIEILDITEVNFRKKLSRTRTELQNYMNNQCSLVNPRNKCKCHKKTKAAIERGYVNPKNLQFNKHYLKKVQEIVESSKIGIEDIIELRCDDLFREHPYVVLDNKLVKTLIFDNIVN